MRFLGVAIGLGLGLVAASLLRKEKERSEFVPGDDFHRGDAKVYEGEPGGFTVVKRTEQMAHVAYSPAHPNPDKEGPEAGQGTTYVRWIFSEELGTAEGLLRSGISLVHDTVLPPGASVGLHGHLSEEILYILDGTATMKIVRGDRDIEVVLRKGDAQLTRAGEYHSISNPGNSDLRFMVIGATPRPTA